MSQILDFLKQRNVTDTQIKNLITTLQSNPMNAMQEVASLGLSPEDIQSMISMVMMNPALVAQTAEELGLSEELTQELKNKAGL